MSDAPLRKRGRPPSETPHARLARLEKEIASAREEVSLVERQRYVLLAKAVLAAAERDPALKDKLREALPHHVKSQQAKEAVAPLLAA